MTRGSQDRVHQVLRDGDEKGDDGKIAMRTGTALSGWQRRDQLRPRLIAHAEALTTAETAPSP